jgi:type I restriction enzyme S subunit
MKIGDIATFIKRGVTPSYVDDNGIVVLNQKCIRNGKIIFSESKLTSCTRDYNEDKFVQKNDILINSTGSGTLGRVARFDEDHGKILVDSHITILRCESYDSAFLFHYLRMHEDYIESLGQGSTNQLELTADAIKNIDIPDIPIDQQKKIADMLSPYYFLICNCEEQISLLVETSSRVFEEWFLSDNHANQNDTTNVSEVSSFLKRGISPKYDELGQYSVINQKCIRNAVMNISEARKESKEFSDEYYLQDGDTVICSTGIGTLGRVGQVFGDYPNTTFDSHVTVVRANERIGKHYLYHAIKSKQAYLMSMGRGSTNQQELYRAVIEELKLSLPEKEMMFAFEKMADNNHKKVNSLLEMKRHAEEAYSRVLPKLMNGEIEI